LKERDREKRRKRRRRRERKTRKGNGKGRCTFAMRWTFQQWKQLPWWDLLRNTHGSQLRVPRLNSHSYKLRWNSITEP
jgi:hypothetical protein